MFISLLKRVFNGNRASAQANYVYFEETRNSQQEEAEQAINQLQNELAQTAISMTTPEEQQQKAFYDFLFGDSSVNTSQDELTLFVTEQIEKLLANPKYILEALPVLPTSLAKVLAQLNDEAFDTEVLIVLIEQEPVIAAKVIELANSALYKRGDKDITDLKSAFMQLGTQGLIEGVINGFVSKLTPNSPIYFQQYGQKIWQHSQSTGDIAKALVLQSEIKEEASQAYLLGLICNLGDMIIYQLLMEAFSIVHPDCQPNSFAFKELMYKNSKKLTYHIAKYWHFPEPILKTLALQAKINKTTLLKPLLAQRPIACYIYEANLISELMMQNQNKDQLMVTAVELTFTEQAHQFIQQHAGSDDN